ncbi:MAG: hypothetical protein WAU02_04025 [Candidatus Saccharimonadales bacterium]
MLINKYETDPAVIQQALIEQGYVDTSDDRAIAIAIRHEEAIAAEEAAEATTTDENTRRLARRQAAVALGESGLTKPRLEWTTDQFGGVISVNPIEHSRS